MSKITAQAAPMLNAYPDSVGSCLGDMVQLLEKPELRGVFQSFYILPSLFNTDLDRGFSVVDYSLSDVYATREDLEKLEKLGMDLKLDFILNHASVLSPQFQDILKNGDNSPYRDFFIDWNTFWAGHGTMTEEGYIQPDPELIRDMFFRKPGLPILMVRFPDGRDVPYWNTFYQDVQYQRPTIQQLMKIASVQYGVANQLHNLLCCALDEGKKPSEIEFGKFEHCRDSVVEWLENHREYLGQMDLNIKSAKVWEFYDDTLTKLADYGAKIVRLDAFAYAPKEPGEKNFLNEPGTWDLLERIRVLADRHGLKLLPEIHASYGEKIYEKVAQKGYMTYDFFLPGLIIDAFEEQDGRYLRQWAQELFDKKIHTVNMLGCHDGIPLLDLKGLISDEQIQRLIDTVVARGGYVKNLHGQKNMYYQVNATYYSALGEDDRRMLLARAIQLFMPGKPQVWYLDLFAGKNDHEAVRRAGPGGHKEINRTNLTLPQIEEALQKDVVRKQLELLRFRSNCPAFGFDSQLEVGGEGNLLTLKWINGESWAKLTADLKEYSWKIETDS
ncbi:MAG TPA: glycosidase [Candidatus Gallacutalibacter pullistercoris]|nr:glycosidase [Candidatus Gallacutalibacter pullistercoris]